MKNCPVCNIENPKFWINKVVKFNGEIINGKIQAVKNEEAIEVFCTNCGNEVTYKIDIDLIQFD